MFGEAEGAGLGQGGAALSAAVLLEMWQLLPGILQSVGELLFLLPQGTVWAWTKGLVCHCRLNLAV